MAPSYELRFGRAATLRDGTDITLIANGVMVHRALEAAELLAAAGVSARVLDMATASPIDTDAIVAAARETRGIVTAEEHTVRGGLGGAVAEVVVDAPPGADAHPGHPGRLRADRLRRVPARPLRPGRRRHPGCRAVDPGRACRRQP